EIQELIEHLQDNGITMEDTVEISDSNKDPVKYQLQDITEEFKIDNLKIYLDDKEIYNNGDVSDEDEIILETDVKGKFAVELKLLLSDSDENIENFDVYEKPLKWNWTLHQTFEEERSKQEENENYSFQATNAPLVASTTTAEDNEKETDSKSNETDNDNQSDDKDEDKKSDNESKDDSKKDSSDDKDESDKDSSDKSSKKLDEDTKKKSDEKSDKKSKKDTKSKSEKDSDSNAEDDEEDEKEPEIEKVEINNYFKHQVTKPVIDESTL